MRPLTADEKRWGLWDEAGARQELEPTGRLEFSIRAWTDQPLRKTWLETETKPLEAMLPEIVATFLVLGPLLAERGRRRQEEARIFAERQRLEELERQRRRQDDNRWARFVELAHGWKQAELARDFIAELRRLKAGGDVEIDGRSVADWLDWAEARADAADPLHRGLGDVFAETGEVSAWSYPSGPHSNRRFT